VPPEVASGDVPSSKADSLTIEVFSAKIVATEVTSHREIVPTATISTGVTNVDTSAIDTSAPSDNDHKNSAINFLYTVFLSSTPKLFLQKP